MNPDKDASLAHWLIGRKVYYVQITSDPLMSKFRGVFRLLIEDLKMANSDVHLLVDASNMEIALSTWNCIIEMQYKLRTLPVVRVYVVGQSQNRLMRLMMMRLFDMTHAVVIFYNTIDEAMKTIPAEC